MCVRKKYNKVWICSSEKEKQRKRERVCMCVCQCVKGKPQERVGVK